MPVDPWGIASSEDARASAPKGGGDEWGIAKVEDLAPAKPRVAASAPPSLPLARMPIPRALQRSPDAATLGTIGMYGVPLPAPEGLDAPAIVRESAARTKRYVGALGEILEHNPEYNGQAGTPTLPTPGQVKEFGDASQRGLLALSEGAKPGTFTRGALSAAEGLTTPENAHLLLGTAATGGTLGAIAEGATGYNLVAAKSVNLALSAYFTAQAAKGFSDSTQAAYQAWKGGDYAGVAENLGAGTINGIFAGLGLFHGKATAYDILKTKVPKPALNPEVVPPEATPEPEPLRAAQPQTVDVGEAPPPAPEAAPAPPPTRTTRTRRAPVAPSVSPLTADAGRVGETLQPPPPEPPPPASDSPKAAAETPSPAAVPEPEMHGDMHGNAPAAGPSDWSIAKVEEPKAEQAPAPAKESTVEMASEPGAGDWSIAKVEEPRADVDAPREVAPAPAAESKPDQTFEPESTPDEPPTAELQKVESRGVSHYGDATKIPVPGESTVYGARYAVRELADVQPSHNGQSFEPNPAYEHRNDRDYSKPGNAERIVRQAATFEPSYLLSDNPDAVNGAPIVDGRGNVLGGNSRAMTLGRVYASRPEAAQNYREMLEAKAPAFGLDREQVRAMKQPVLVREADDTEDPQKAITDFNKTGTAALTTSERAVADARRVSTDTLEYLGRQIADEGDDATLAKVLGGSKGPRLIQRLIDDGVITPQEKPQYLDERGLVTSEGKTRLTRTVVGRLFDTPTDYEQAAPELRNKLERVVGPLARVEEIPGWALTSQTKEAVRMLGEARARGIRNLDDLASQNNLFGSGERDPEALAIAHVLQLGPRKAAAAFQQYASDAEIGRGGATLAFLEPPSPAESFEEAFGLRQHEEAGVLFAKTLDHEMTPDGPRGSVSRDQTYRNLDWEVLPQSRSNRPVRLRLNRQALDLIADAVAPDSIIDGFAMVPKEPGRYAYRFALHAQEQHRKGEISSEALHRVVEFARAMDALNGERLIGYLSDTSSSLAWKAHTLREELTHWEQGKLGPNANGIEHIDALELAKHPLWPPVRAALLRDGYPDNPDVLAIEAGSKLATGETIELGLTARGARRLLREYYRLLVERNGESTARQVLRFAPRMVRKEIERAALSKNARRSGLNRPVPPGTSSFSRRPADGGSHFESSERSEFAGSRGELASREALRRLREGRAESDGSALRQDVPGEAAFAKRRSEPNERSLFDAGTDEQVASDAALDRDQLTGDRLTAQLNAPLTREEQLGKLKTSKSQKQSALFEDNSDAQGSFFLGSGLGAMQPFVTQFLKDDVVPTARQTAEVLKLAGDDVRKVFAPASRGADAKATAMSVRANAAELARSTDRAQAALKVASKYFASRPAADNYAFMDAVETGSAQASGQLDQVAQVMREMLDTRREAIQRLGTGKLSNWIENYFPHLWEQNGKARQVFDGRRPLEGGKAFLKQRKIATIKDGLALGLTPISDNPVDFVLAKAREMDKYLAAHRILADMKESGILQYKRAAAPMPDGFAAVDDKVATVYGTPSHDGALQVQGHWVAPEPATRVLNNYLSPGLAEQSGLFRGILSASNLINQAQLSFSAFHLSFTTSDVITSKLALGLYKLGHADWKGLKDVALTPVAPVANLLRGDKLLKEWYNPGSQGGPVSALVDAVVQAGGRARMDSFYQTQVTKRMVDAFRKGNVLGALLRVPFAAMELAAKPIMEYIVPRQKLGVFADLAKYELERLGPNASAQETRAVLARAWDSVDNRLGQLVYDNLFWHKVTKDLAMISVRSVGWNIGTIRELGGSVPDAAKFASGKGDFTPRMSYALALPAVAALMGAIAYYLWHKKAPEKLIDYFAPPDAHGHRHLLATYMKDVLAWSHDPIGTAEGKLNPLIRLTWEMLSNRDFFDKPIRNARHSLVMQAEEAAKHVGLAYLPMWAQPHKHETPADANERRALGMIGITPAPKWIDHPTRRH